MRKWIALITLFLMTATVFTGCSLLEKLGIVQGDDEELRPASSIVLGEDEAKKLTDKVPIHLYFANQDNTKLMKEIRFIPMSEAKKSTENLASVIVKELINGPTEGNGLIATIPKEAQLRSPVSINAGVATVDLTGEFIDKHPGGKAAEQMTIFSIVNSLTELKEIEKVKFLINGKAKKDFKGNFQFDAPFPRSTTLISKETVAPGLINGDLPADGSGGVMEDSEDTYIELEEEEEEVLE